MDLMVSDSTISKMNQGEITLYEILRENLPNIFFDIAFELGKGRAIASLFRVTKTLEFLWIFLSRKVILEPCAAFL